MLDAHIDLIANIPKFLAFILFAACYEIIIYWSDEDQAFIAEVPELPGCAADGETYQEAISKVELIIKEWIDTALS